MKRSRLVIVGPLPPPTHGVAISTKLALGNALLREHFEVEHLDTTDRRSISNIGRWDLGNVARGLASVATLVRRLRPRGTLYLPLSESTGGFVRDSLLIQLASRAGWRVAVHIRNCDFRTFYEARSALGRAWVRSTLARIDSVAILGESLRGIFDGLVEPDRLVVVPNGTPELDLHATNRRDDLVLYLSNLMPRKGIREAVEAAARVVKRHPTARFLFVGQWVEDSLERELTSVAAPAGERIEFRPATTTESEKRELLGEAAILLFPPRGSEGHPRIVLESMAAGLPLVTTDVATIRETVGDEDGAFVLPEPDPAEMAERLLRLLDDESLRYRMGNAARARYLASYTQEIADRRLAEWLVRVAG